MSEGTFIDLAENTYIDNGTNPVITMKMIILFCYETITYMIFKKRKISIYPTEIRKSYSELYII